MCPDVPNAWTAVTWEQPIGFVHLGQYGRTAKLGPKSESHQVWCRYDIIQNFPRSHALQRSRRDYPTSPLIKLQPRQSPESLTITIGCQWTVPLAEGQDVVYRWKKSWDDDMHEGQEFTTELIDPTLSHSVEKERRMVTCQVEDRTSGETLGSADVNLFPIPIRAIGIIDMKDGGRKLFSFEPEESVQIICDVDKQLVNNSKEVQWFFNSGPLREHVKRIDRLYVSMLILLNMSPEDEGVYTCGQNQRETQVHLIHKSVKLALELQPELDTQWANAGAATEFHCRLQGRKGGNQLIDWSFIPDGSETEVHLEPDVFVDRPDATPSTSFITIRNIQRHHGGTYVCRAFDLKQTARLVVRERGLTVTPETVDARPGTTVRFLCELSSIPGISGGKIFWMRTDRRDLRPGKEEVIGSSGGRALLIVKSLQWEDNNVTYVCSDGVSNVQATVFVRDACAPGFRSCNSRECVESNRFCDGNADCADGSDEDPSKCLDCAPNEYACEVLEGKKPLRNCYLQYWHCDGEDDCGNNFDESACPPLSKPERCNGSHFVCPSSGKLIARSFMCDKTPDCEPDGEDEEECSLPTIIDPSGETQLFGLQSGTLTLTCTSYGRPPPAISWRFNWGGIREGVDHSINTTVIDCNKVISHLTLHNLEPQASGLYTCEAVNRGRALAPDISVTVAKGGLCTPPNFNDGAWFEDMCLPCYCSGVSSECYSAKGYIKSPTPKFWNFAKVPWSIRVYSNGDALETDDGVETTDKLIRFTGRHEGNVFLEGAFGFQGSWVNSYGYHIKFKLRQFGSTSDFLPGPLLVLHSPNQSIYWCPPGDRIILYTLPVGYENELSVLLNERERWYLDANCSRRLKNSGGRRLFMSVLSEVERVGIRVKNYKTQVSTEVQDLVLEFATKSDLPGAWIAEVEQCVCPPGYEGLSCERCASGFEKDPSEIGRCRPKCACDKCDESGACLECPGNRSGPRCQHCQPGFYRPGRSALSEDCIPCAKCVGPHVHVVKDCIGVSFTHDDHVCKCQPREDGKLLSPECDLCLVAQTQGTQPPPEANCEAKPQPLECNAIGTKTVSETQECTCYEGYEGPQCSHCSAGYFPYLNRCLQCFCAGQTSSCQLAEDYRFVNISLVNPVGVWSDIWLAKRTQSGGLERVEDTAAESPRVERTQTGFVVHRPLLEKGLVHLAIQLTQKNAAVPLSSDIPLYRFLYGGQMSFRLDSADLDPRLLTQGDARVVIELESARYGRVWTQAAFNIANQKYEVEFDENWWPGGWKLGTPSRIDGHGPLQGLTRGQLLRVLATTTSIGILTSSGKSEGPKGLRLFDIFMQIAVPTDHIAARAAGPALAVAPVERCDCPLPTQPGERKLSLSCEGCRDPKKQTVIRLEPLGEDFGCAECSGPSCDECPSGFFKYNVYTGERYETCQPSLIIETTPRAIIVEEGDPVSLFCRASSYRDGIVIHEWVAPDTVDRARLITSRRALPPTVSRLIKKQHAPNYTMHRSEAGLHLPAADKGDSGNYTCRATGVGAIVEEITYLLVRDKGPIVPLSVPEGDSLNKKYSINVPRNRESPAWATYQVEADPTDTGTTIVRAVADKPSELASHQLLWLSANGTRIPSEELMVDEGTGVIQYRLSVPHESIERNEHAMQGYFVGTDPVSNPYWTPMKQPEVTWRDKEEVLPPDIMKPPSEVRIPFMQPHVLEVKVKPGKSKIRVEWKKVNYTSEDTPRRYLPDGVEQDGDNLIFWAAASQHEGVYNGTVYRDSDGIELQHFNTTVHVDPLHHGTEKHLGRGEAVDLPEDIKDQEVEKAPVVWDFLVQGFTPEAEYCANPTWTLTDYQGGRTIDITDRVHRLSPTNFRVDYPLTSGIHLKFQCKPVPLSHLTGAILFNISSDDPRIVFQTVYDHPNSTFPTRLICLDLNPSLDSNVSITADSMRAEKLKDALVSVIQEGGVHQYGLLPRKVELDWRRIGGFDPFYDAGRFTCLVSNVETSGSKTVTVPEEKVPVEIPDDPSSRLYIYSPDAYVGSEVDGKAVVEVNEGGQLRLFCHYDSRPMEDFHGWSSESPIVQSHTQITMRQSSSLANFSIIPLELDEQTLECKVKDKVKSVQLKVVPKGKTRMLIRVASEALSDDRIAAVTGQDMELRCEVKHITSPPVSIDRFDWYLQYGNGVRRAVGSSGLAESIELEDRGRILRFTGLSKTPTGAKIFCVVRPTDVHTAVQAYYRSQLVDFWIRCPKLIATIQPVDPHGFVVGVEGGTIRLHCATKDVWRNKTMDKLNVTWETRITSAKGSLPLTDSDRPWKVTKPLNSYFFIAGLQWTPNRVGQIRCRAEDPFSGVFAFSDWTPINVLQEKIVSQTPRLRIVPAVNPTFPFYPTKVECVDDNLEIPSEVMWTRQTGPIAPDQVDSRPNSATITWKVGDAEQFDPFTHADVYTCTATNAHSSTSQQYFFPDEMMPKEPIPFGEHKLIISSSINDLFHETDGSYTRVVQGHPFELLCTYYGYPSPPGGLLWSVEHVGGTDRSTTGSEWMAAQGLRVRAGRRYWTQVSTDRFDETGKHAGIFRCAALNADGTVYKQTQVRVELYQVIVKVNELADSGLIEGVEGQSGTISCSAYDGYHNFILPGAVYSWEFEKLNGARVHPNLLATKVLFDENRVNYEGLSPASAGIRARCVATNNSARYVSPDFGFRVRRLPKGAVIRPEIEHGGRKWVKGDGSEGVLLVISGTNEVTGHVSISEGDSVNLTCIAIDAVTKKRLSGGDFSFGWRVFNLTGEPVAASQLTEGSLQTQSSSDGDAGYFLIDAARTSPAAPRPTAMIECLATKRREAVTYYSSTIDYVVYPKEVIPDYEKERRIRNERNNIQVKVDGLDSRGMLFANEGSVKRLICEALDRSKGSKPMESVQYSWEFSRLDGSSVDTAVLVQPNFGEIHFNGSQVMFRGLRRESAARGRCKVVITDESTGEGEREMVHYSPYFKFDVIDDSGLGHRVFIPPAKPEALDGLVGSVAGLDENGYLTSSPGEDFNLSCIVMNASTGETFTSPRLVVHYGWEFQQSNGLPASTLDVAESVQTNEAKGELKMMQLRTQPDIKPTRGRCVIELIPVNDQATLSPTEKGFIGRRFSSPYFLINVPPKDEIMPDYADTTHQRYELNVQGLNEFGALPLRLKELAELTCLVRDTETDTLMDILLPSQAIGWQLPVHLSGQVGNLGDVARRVRSDRTKLYLDDIREDVSGGLRGRCWFFDGLVYYYSPYFPIVQPHQLADARVTVEVREVGTEDDRRYVCTAYDSNTGAVLHDVSYDWSFTAPTGELVLPSYYMESVETQGNLLAVRPGGYSQRLPANLRGNGPIEGRCLVLYQTYTGNLTKPDTVVVYGSRPFILIDPEADDPDRVLIRPEPYEKSRRVVVKVEGLTHGIVSAPESGTVTLTCKAIDTQKMSPIADASYRWEIQQRDGSPVSTSFITHKAVLIQKVPFGSQLTLVGLRPKAAGARGRCIVANTSATPAVDSLITPGTEVASPFFEFQVHRTPLEVSEYPDEDYEGHSDFIVDGDSRLHEVVVVGLDEKGRLVAKPGDDVKLEIKLKANGTDNILTENKVTYGWQFLEPTDDVLMSPLAETSHLSGPVLQLRKLALLQGKAMQFTLRGWCLVDVSPRDQVEDVPVKHYRSNPFSLIVNSATYREDDTDATFDVAKELFIRVDGVSEDGMLKAKEGEDKVLDCIAIETSTGFPTASPEVTYGWEWRSLDGDVADISMLASDIASHANKLQISALKPTTPVKGRCVVVAPSPLEILDDDIEQKPKKPPQKYLSDFFFVSVEPADPKTEHLLPSCRPVEAKDAEVKVTIWPGEEETITLQFGSQHEFIITATRSDGSSVQTTSTGYELAYLSGEPAPTSEIAKEVSFSVHRGTLNIKDIQYPTKPLKLRAFVHVSTTKLDESNEEDQSAKDKSCSPIIYRSEYMPINVLTPEGESQPPWIDRLFPIYDAAGDAYKVTVLGLDDDGNAAAEPGGTIELTCSVHDKFGFDADLEFNGYSWVLLNGSGHLVSPSALADKVEIIEGKTLRVSGYHPSAYRQGIRGRCVINIPVPVPVNATLSPDVPPTQRFISPYFTFTQKEPTDLVDKPETETPTPSEHETTPPVTDGGRPATTGFTLVVDSPSNPVYETKENKNIVLARIQRPFEETSSVRVPSDSYGARTRDLTFGSLWLRSLSYWRRQQPL
ncbi:unnamed protein product [Dicrocoelium dendriticum]|nr:unnamed protein product [Dicrocoelium dendriticum]